MGKDKHNPPRLSTCEEGWSCQHCRDPGKESWPPSATGQAMRAPHRTNQRGTCLPQKNVGVWSRKEQDREGFRKTKDKDPIPDTLLGHCECSVFWTDSSALQLEVMALVSFSIHLMSA
jgi:hypothetical protein